MKYPQNQFEILVKTARILKQYIDIEAMNLHKLYFLIYQQFDKGQFHNCLVLNNGKVEKNYTLKEDGQIEYKTDKGVQKLVPFDFDFELAPKGINDNHISTAMKKVLKTL